MEKDDSFWLNICYIAFAAICGYVSWQAVYTLGVQTGWGERYDSWYLPVNYGSAMALGVASAWFLRSSTERHDYLLAAIGELRKVSWPSVEDTRRMTIIVCVVVAIFAMIMLVFDMSWTYILRHIVAAFS